MKIGYSGNVSIGTIAKTVESLSAREFSALINERFGEGHPAIDLLGTTETGWQDESYQTAVGHEHNLYASGGVGQVPYRVSLGYTN